MVGIKVCCVVGRTESPCNDKSNGVIRMRDVIVGAVDTNFCWNVNTSRALNCRRIEAVISFT